MMPAMLSAPSERRALARSVPPVTETVVDDVWPVWKKSFTLSGCAIHGLPLVGRELVDHLPVEARTEALVEAVVRRRRAIDEREFAARALTVVVLVVPATRRSVEREDLARVDSGRGRCFDRFFVVMTMTPFVAREP